MPLILRQKQINQRSLKIQKKVDIPKIIETIKAIPEDRRYEAEKALLNFLDDGIRVERRYYGNSLRIRICNYGPLAENCDAVPEDLMRHVLDNIERNDGHGVVQELYFNYTQKPKDRVDRALEILEKNKNVDCSSCKLFKNFLEHQKALIEQRDKEKTIVESIQISQKREELKELLK